MNGNQRLKGLVACVAFEVVLSSIPAALASQISAVTYEPADQTLKVMLQSGETVVHPGVPEALYEEFMAASDGATFYEERIVKDYPRRETEPMAEEMDLGPIDGDYVAGLADVPPALLDLCDKALQNAAQAGKAAVVGIERLDSRATKEGDDSAGLIAASAKNTVHAARWALREAQRRMDRKEYKAAHRQVGKASEQVAQLLESLKELAPHGSSVTIREQHQASHYISAFSQWLVLAEKQLERLRISVEQPKPAEEAAPEGE